MFLMTQFVAVFSLYFFFCESKIKHSFY